MRLRHLGAACGTCAAGVSVACMSSMAASLAAAGAGAAGMGAMGDAAPGAGLSVLPGLLDAVGLGFASALPNAILQPLLVALLTLSVAATSLASRGHAGPWVVILAASSALVMYSSIYVWMSDALYLASLVGLLGSSGWSVSLSRRVPRAAARQAERAG